MTIEVTGCHDCPFCELDDYGTVLYYCNHFTNPLYNVHKHHEKGTLHPSCPLKQETITISLKETKKPIYDGCATCKNNIDGIEAGVWCITNCINGSKYEKKR